MKEVVDAYLTAVDVAVPGLVQGLFLTGSVALGDFRPQQSDVDFVAVTAARPDPARRAALGRVHADVRRRWPRPSFEGVYVTWDDLATDPLLVAPAPFVHDGRFADAGRFELNPVTWHVLANHGVAGRGPAAADARVAVDPASLASWLRGNLDGYWRRWQAQRVRLWSRAGLGMLGDWAPVWGVLGVSRIHYTLATGAITSKAGAGRYALETFPRPWQRLLEECLRLRGGAPGPSWYRSRLARRREALAFMTMAIADAMTLCPLDPPAGGPAGRHADGHLEGRRWQVDPGDINRAASGTTMTTTR